jgi:predicted ATPase
MASNAFVGRETELGAVEEALAKARAGTGCTIMVSGEPGIGKTRFVEQCKVTAEKSGMKVLAGAALSDSAQPFLVFSKALGGLSDRPLLDETETVSFAAIFLTSQAGEVTAKAMSHEMDAESIANTLAAVQSFVGDSFQSASGHMGRMTYGDMSVLAERSGEGILCGVVIGSEHPDMIKELKRSAQSISTGQTLPETEISSLAMKKFTMRRDLSGIKLDSERNKLADRTLDVLKTITSHSPVLLVLEDMHWGDEISLYVFGYLARSSPRSLAILATARQCESKLWDQTQNILKGDGYVNELCLGRMDEMNVKNLINATFSPNKFPPEFFSKLAKDCEGNPLFTVEMVAQMASEDSVKFSDGYYVLAVENYAMPGKIEDIVLRRLESLEPAALALAEYSSCAGREFPSNLVLSVPTFRKPERSLASLEQAGIVSIHGKAVEFRHAMFMEAIYNSVTPKWRMTYHKGIGEYYESAYKGRHDEVIYELARHFANSNEQIKAFEYCSKAGEKAESTFAMEKAAEFFKWALVALQKIKIIGQTERELELNERLGDLQTLTSQYSASIASYASAISKASENNSKARLHRKISEVSWKLGNYDDTLAEVSKGEEIVEDQLEKARLLHQRSYILMRRGDYDKAIEMCNGILAMLDGIPKSEKEVGSVHDTLGSSYHKKGDHAVALEHYNKCLEIAKNTGDLRKVGAVYNNIGNVYGDRLQNDKCREYYDKALKIFEKLGDKQGISVILGNTGAIYHSIGDMEKALEYYERSLRMAEAIGDQRMVSGDLGNLGATYSSLGEHRRAIEMFERALRIYERLGDQDGQTWAFSSIGESLHLLGEMDRGMEYLKKGLDLAVKIDDQWKVCTAEMYIADLLREKKELTEASLHYKKCNDLAKQLDSSDIIIDSFSGMAETFADEGKLSEALECVIQAEKLGRETGLKVELASTLCVQGMILSLLGKRGEAEAKFKESFDIYSGISNKIGKAKLTYEWGKALLAWGEHEKGKEMIGQARDSFASSEMRLWVERCDSALGHVNPSN